MGSVISADIWTRFLASLADVRRYPYRERLPQWRDRLADNAPELDVLWNAPRVEAAPYRAQDCSQIGDILLEASPFERIPETVAAGGMNPLARFTSCVSQARSCAALNAFISIADYDQEAASAYSGSLQGVTVAVKDLMLVTGLPLTGGSRATCGAVAGRDATSVARLRRVGGLIAGTTNLHELAYGVTSENPHFGTVDNPTLPNHIAGGSSGGSAAAVAAHIVDCALGTDTAGSIRIPAACCGVVGYKPSFGLIPVDGVMPLGWSLDHIGPITRSVGDAAALTAVLANSSFTVSEPQPRRRPLRILRPQNYFFDYLQPRVRVIIESVFQTLKAHGCEVVEGDVGLLEVAAGAQFVTLCTEATENYYELLLNRPEGLGEDVRVRLEVGQFMCAVDYQRAQRLRQQMVREWRLALENVDLVLTPTLVAEPPLQGAREVRIGNKRLPIQTTMSRCTMPFNLTGMPALTMPVSGSSGRWPVGIQIAALNGQDSLLLEAGQRIERIMKCHGAGLAHL